MKRWARALASAVTLSGLLLGLVAPASASCPCAARKAAQMRSCPRCAACGDVVVGPNLVRPACCTSRTASTPPAVSPAPVQVDKPDFTGSGVLTLAAAMANAGASGFEAIHHRTGESPPRATLPSHHSTYLRL